MIIWANQLSNIFLSAYMLVGIGIGWLIVKSMKNNPNKEDKIFIGMLGDSGYNFIYLLMALFWLPAIVFGIRDAIKNKKEK